MGVLEQHQDRPALGKTFDLANERVQQKLPLALRSEVESGNGIGQGEQLGDQLDLVGIVGGEAEQRGQLGAFFYRS